MAVSSLHTLADVLCLKEAITLSSRLANGSLVASTLDEDERAGRRSIKGDSATFSRKFILVSVSIKFKIFICHSSIGKQH